MWHEPGFVERELLTPDADLVPRPKMRSFCGVLGQMCDDLRDGQLPGGLKQFVVDLALEWTVC